jgi:hypothetical protein
MQALTFGSRIVRRFGTAVGIAVIALAIGFGGIGGHGAAAWGASHAAPAGAGFAARPMDPPGHGAGTAASRYGGGGGLLASRT